MVRKKEKVSDAKVTPHAHRTYLLGNYLCPFHLAPIEIVSMFPPFSLIDSKLLCLLNEIAHSI